MASSTIEIPFSYAAEGEKRGHEENTGGKEKNQPTKKIKLNRSQEGQNVNPAPMQVQEGNSIQTIGHIPTEGTAPIAQAPSRHLQVHQNIVSSPPSSQGLPETHSAALPPPPSILPTWLLRTIEIIKNVEAKKSEDARHIIQELHRESLLPDKEITYDDMYWRKILSDLTKERFDQAENKLKTLIWRELCKSLLAAIQEKRTEDARNIIQKFHKESLLPGKEITHDDKYWRRILSDLAKEKLDQAKNKLSSLYESINGPAHSRASVEKSTGSGASGLDNPHLAGFVQKKSNEKEKEVSSSSGVGIEHLLSSLLGAKNLTNDHESPNLFVQKIVIGYLLPHAKRRVILASDQFTYDKLAEELVKVHSKHIPVSVIVGDNPKGREIANYLEHHGVKLISIMSGRELESGGVKMHNKFIVIDDQVVLGSPNATYYAYEKNIESLIVIHNRALADLYARYVDFIAEDAKSRNGGEFLAQRKREADFRGEIRKFNEEEGRGELEVCLAPVCSIKDFIHHAVQDAAEIKINMFLISADATQIMQSLINASEQGANITLNIDGNQYDTLTHVQNAIGVLKQTAANNRRKKIKSTVQLNKIYGEGGSFHDKLILVEKKDGEKFVIIGSAGFSKDVNNDNNYENMIIIKNNSVFSFFERHVNKCLEGKVPL